MPPAWEHLHGATSILVSSGNIKTRLTEAYTRHLNDLELAEVPREIRDAYASLTRTLTEVSPLKGETAVAATVRKMSNEQADQCAAQIVAMLATLYRAQLASAGPAAEVVSLYVAEA